VRRRFMKGHKEEGGPDPLGAEPPERQLSIRQEYAIQLLLKGLKDAEVARLVEVRGSQLQAWKENPRFRRAWARARPNDKAWMLGGLTTFDRDRKRRPKPETRWTSEKEDEIDD
jgi:hypothetical protein